MFFPGAGKTMTTTAATSATAATSTTTINTADIMIGDTTKYFSYCKSFKYLGTTFTPSLKDDVDIKKRITQATKAFATMEKTLRDKKLNPCYKIKIYKATVLNILLWGCESWALTTELRRQLEVCHNRFLRRMANINIYEVMKKHMKK